MPLASRSDNRGYEKTRRSGLVLLKGLQWVHGPVTVVMGSSCPSRSSGSSGFKNNLGEPILATPALVDGKIYVRTEKNLYAFGD